MFADTRIEILGRSLLLLEIPFKSAVHLPFGTIESRPSVWLALHTRTNGATVTGYAEGTGLPVAIPMYDDCSDNLRRNVEMLVSCLIGKTIRLGNLPSTIASVELGGRFPTARMALECAAIDAAARFHGTSVAEALGIIKSGSKVELPYGKSITENTKLGLEKEFATALANGARRVKVKVSPDTFAVVFDFLQSTVPHSETDFMVDANGTFDPTDSAHLEQLRCLDSVGLLAIEEPVSRYGSARGLVAYRMLRNHITFETPIIADDSVISAEVAIDALRSGAVRGVNLKPGRIGSFIECMRVADVARSLGQEVMVGGMFEATPGRMMTMTLAAYCEKQGFRIAGDISLPGERLVEDLVSDRIIRSPDGLLSFTPKAGWGFSVDY